MKLNKIKIENYKSVGEEDNIMSVDKINIIIGKNESGKTNIIESLASMNLTGIENDGLFNSKNKINNKKPYFELQLSSYPYEIRNYKKLEIMDISIKSDYDIEYTGGFQWYFHDDKKYTQPLQIINDIIDSNNIQFYDNVVNNNFKELIRSLNDADKKIFINFKKYNTAIERLKNSNYDFKQELLNNIDKCIEQIRNVYKLLPTFFELDNKMLKNNYSKSDIEKNEDCQMLKILFDVAGISEEQIFDYWQTTDPAEKHQIIRKLNHLLQENVSKKFNEFYTQEKISIEIDLDNESVTFLVSTTDTYLNYSERSNGLKWYFNIFLKMTNKNIDKKNVIYVIDEPGVMLHVNAQKELLKYFTKLTNDNNQLIYSTHSPYMLYQDDLNIIRPIIKDENGYTHIYNKYNSVPNSSCKIDTLTPIYETIGMRHEYNFEIPSKNINIITEGVSDANYIKGYLIYSKNKFLNKLNFVSSTGANNVDKLVSIMIGWGCKYFVLLDNDQQGRDEFQLLVDKLCVPKEKICFTDGTNVINTKLKHDIESCFNNEDRKKYIDKPDYNMFKNKYSKEFLDDIENNKIELSQETLNNFENIINRIKID